MTRRLRRIVVMGVVSAVLLMGWKVLQPAYSEYRSFIPRRGPVARPPGAPAEMVDATLGSNIRGWWISSKNGAAVVLAHGSFANRAQLAYEMSFLSLEGYGVLAFDWPGYGESGGQVRLGRAEVDSVRAAVDFVSSQPNVQPGRIGAIAFSAGGALMLAAGAEESRLRALVLEGAFTDMIEQTRYEFRRSGAVAVAVGVQVARWMTEGGNLRPIDRAGKLRGRTKVLAIAGGEDPVVPPSMSLDIARATGGVAWIIPGCGHGGYAQAAPEEYRNRITSFFRDELPR